MTIDELFPGIGAKGFWILARLAHPPSGTGAWRPSLPSYGYPLQSPPTMPAGFRQYLLRNASAAVHPAVLQEVTIQWRVRQFGIAGSYSELPSHFIGEVVVQRESLP